MTLPFRAEYPRPQFVRSDWMNLNGNWQFEIDQGDSGLERGLLSRDLNSVINVPFCPESSLSGIGFTDFVAALWYKRSVEVPAEWEGKHVLLHFGAVDYDATVWVNRKEVGRHRGGFSPFTIDLGPVTGSVELAVRAREPRGEERPAGKQSIVDYENRVCLYTRTSGIWQTVWMEPVSKLHFARRPRITPDVPGQRFSLEFALSQNEPGSRVRATLFSEEHDVLAISETAADMGLAPRIDLIIPPCAIRTWEPGDSYLYPILLELFTGGDTASDYIETYAGLRSISIDGQRIRVNGRVIFQRLVLDQGYYPDGLMTAPDDESMIRDIEISMAAGFNGARLHQKVFEERFLYHADRLGYMVWGEFGDWGLAYDMAPHRSGRSTDPRRHQAAAAAMRQWLEVLERDYSHPAIIGWCPLNESREKIQDHITTLDDLTYGMFLATKAMDLTRPVLDASGYSHRIPESDVYDSHQYEQDPEIFRKRFCDMAEDDAFNNSAEWSIPYRGQPYLVSEFGGAWWNPREWPKDCDRSVSWGYGERPTSEEAFLQRFDGLCSILLENRHIIGYCYTQLTDVFQEENGLFTFSREPKFPVKRLAEIQGKLAAIEAASLDLGRSKFPTSPDTVHHLLVGSLAPGS